MFCVALAQVPASRPGEPPAAASRPADAPNVVIFLIDTLRIDRVGAYGYDKPTTPAIDALAAEGIVFEQAYASGPWTLPSVVSMFTSTPPCEHNCFIDGQKVAAELQPLAVRMKRAGYVTAAFYANQYVGPMTGLQAGYDEFRMNWSTGARDVEPWYDRKPAGPFFLYIHNLEPHEPQRTPDKFVKPFGFVSREQKQAVERLLREYRKLSRVDYSAKQPRGTTDNTAEQDKVLKSLVRFRAVYDALYDGAVRQADQRVGSVIELLKQRGVWDNTLFVLVADHGEELGDHGSWLHGQSVYQELVHIPTIVKLPKGELAGTRVSDIVSLIDVLPTVIDVIGRPELLQPSRGVSLQAVARGQNPRSPTDPVVTSMRHEAKKYYRPHKQARGDINLVARQGNWKAIWNVELDAIELYDLSADPAEQADVAGENAEVAARLHTFLKSWLADCRSVAQQQTPGGLEGADKETIENLRSLGYVD